MGLCWPISDKRGNTCPSFHLIVYLIAIFFAALTRTAVNAAEKHLRLDASGPACKHMRVKRRATEACITGRLITLCPASVTGHLTTLGSARLAGCLTASGLARIAGRLARRLITPCLTGIAGLLTRDAGCLATLGTAGIARCLVAVGTACIVSRTKTLSALRSTAACLIRCAPEGLGWTLDSNGCRAIEE